VRKLLLVKHSLPEIAPGVPSAQWRLSEEGRRRCDSLSDALAAHSPARVFTSPEPKAAETAHLVGSRLGLAVQVEDGLRENDRTGFRHLPTDQWEAAFARFFARPHAVTIGKESADQAHARFAVAMERVLGQYHEGTTIVVAHGTVITLYVSRAAGLEPLPFWRRLGLPSFVVMSAPELTLLDVQEQVE
jgi:broad specificity phosphatase PhoE